jgi:rhamnosyltransferase
MLNALETLKQTAPSIGAIGPSRVDPRSGKTMRVRKPVAYLRVHRRSDASQAVQVDHLITSGCLITTDVFQRVGPFREDLFLDYVDIEWSLRARALGYPLYLDTGTAMDHTIGDSIISIAGRTLPVHQALRSYLLLRNHLLLWHSSSAGICWLLGDLRQVILKSLALLVLRPKRLERLRWMAKGIWHGIRGKGGAP